MSHIGEIVVAVILAPVLLAIVLSLGRSIRRVGKMNVGSADYDSLGPGSDPRAHGGLPIDGSHHQHGHHGGHMGGGHIGGGGHVGGGHHG
ncbi:MAG TPA: hypothetical protein VFI65_15285 [Streptosporangiaceae bacterium]|nr:hypothetical protein [Streptosporangiaceae bacterium]